MSTSQPQIFLSYSHSDKEKVYKLHDALSARGLDVWIDKKGVSIGKWKSEIKQVIAQSKYFVFCMSEAALAGIREFPPSVQGEELEYAISIAESQAARQFFIIPIRLEVCEHGDHRLSVWQQYNLYENWEGELNKLSKQLGGATLEKKPVKDSWEPYLKAYSDRMQDRYNMVRIMGMSQPVSLRDLYVRTHILKKLTEYMRLHPKELAKNQQRIWIERDFGSKRETLFGLETINKLQKFVVLGKPGAGKTTFLKRCVLYALDDKLKTARVPIFVGLKRFTESVSLDGDWKPGEKLIEFFLQEFFITKITDSESFIRSLLKRGNALILLDGLDEVREEDKDVVIREIQNISDKYPENQFVISCRIAAYNALFEAFTDVEMADFSEEQIKHFIEHWFKDEVEVGEACWQEMRSQKPVYGLASTPLLLTLLCITYDEANHFPSNRSDIYGEATEVLLKSWDSKRRITREVIYKQLSKKRKESLLAHLAYEAFQDNVIFMPQRRLIRQIGEFIRNLPDTKESNIEQDSEVVLESIIAHHGLIVPRAINIYSFSHLTFQEYFTAKHIVSNRHKNSLEELTKFHLGNNQWREVFLLTAEMLDDADDFFLLMKSLIDYEVEKGFLQYMLVLVDRVINLQNELPLALLRSISIYYMLDHIHSQVREQAKWLVYAIDRDFGFALDLARDIALDRDFYTDFDRERYRIFAQNLSDDTKRDYDLEFDRAQVLDQELDIAFALNQDIISNSQAGDKIKRILYMTQVLIDCLQTECYVSNEVREKILNELLAPPSQPLSP